LTKQQEFEDSLEQSKEAKVKQKAQNNYKKILK